jgi:prolyl-tRNA editing enzyme YbaK/EbsC (Cys-tRNA(Pro) deacylase)
MSLSASAQKVQDALNAFRIQLEVVELPGSTRSAAEAAEAIGCQVAQIAKSLIFKTLVHPMQFFVLLQKTCSGLRLERLFLSNNE